MKKNVNGTFVELDGEKFYKIENFDCMTDFFMTITSSSDVWNFCWAQGGISAGRKNCDNAIFPYYTCDKIKDLKDKTGAFTLIRVKKDGRQGILWQPFMNLGSSKIDKNESIHLSRNIYKNLNGSKVWFEEVNAELGLSYRYGWTSSKKYGLIKMSRIENLTNHKIELQILDGVRNILPPQITADLQNVKSVLLDAYKHSEVDDESEIALFTLSSLITDKAEPAECLFTNVGYFSTDNQVLISDDAIKSFFQTTPDIKISCRLDLNGKRPECFCVRDVTLEKNTSDFWEQILDVNYDAKKLSELKNKLRDRMQFRREMYEDIEETDAMLEKYISQSDGIQTSSNKMQDIHHRTNVMFNIMRGGIFATENKISVNDFAKFTAVRNKKLAEEFNLLCEKNKISLESEIENSEMKKLFEENLQLKRMFLEYLPLTFSRRHGDPSRPWNRFNIDLADETGNAKLNFEGNWRDIFQNWEALLWSYPEYVENICVKFLNAMTVDGFNPYRILRDGIDWEVPEKDNPWAQYGYWTDHQVIYLQKLLEFFYNYNKEEFITLFGKNIFASANVPYRFKSFEEIYENPRSSISFDYELDKSIKQKEVDYGTDARLVMNVDNQVQQTTMATKIVQLILGKAFNLIPGAGIWMNSQRPEWNDANNALAGYGASVVTCCQLYRMLSFFTKLLNENDFKFEINSVVLEFLKTLSVLYEIHGEKAVEDSKERRFFVDKAGRFFEEERKILYKNGFDSKNEKISSKELAALLLKINQVIKLTVKRNLRSDGLFESYNTVIISSDTIEIQNLKLMLEGQVAVLSTDILSVEELTEFTSKLRSSPLFEENQHSYLLYPKVQLQSFQKKNCISEEDLIPLKEFIAKSNGKIFDVDFNGQYHFNAKISNAEVLKLYLSLLNENELPNEEERKLIFDLHEKIFNHQSFTGRSGSFYGYEGIGCIYWHMVSKLLLAVQEQILFFTKRFAGEIKSLQNFYDDIKLGLGFSKKPDVYGAFPYDPYSHTPYLQGAKQPGMTGQVKEEIISRFGELGVKIENGCAMFSSGMLKKSDFSSDGKLEFTWCGTKVVYLKGAKSSEKIKVSYTDKNKSELVFKDYCLDKENSEMLFCRSGDIEQITVNL